MLLAPVAVTEILDGPVNGLVIVRLSVTDSANASDVKSELVNVSVGD